MSELQVTAPPLSLHQLLIALQSSDDMIEEIDLNVQVDLLENAKIKVDNYKYIIDKLESQADYLYAREQEFAAAKMSVKKNIARLKEHLLFALKTNNFEKFTGNSYVVKQGKSAPSISIKAGDAHISHAIRYPQFVKTSYEWDKKALLEALKAGDDEKAQLIAELKQTTYIKFTVNKEAVK